jgi:hypothetical protein
VHLFGGERFLRRMLPDGRGQFPIAIAGGERVKMEFGTNVLVVVSEGKLGLASLRKLTTQFTIVGAPSLISDQL